MAMSTCFAIGFAVIGLLLLVLAVVLAVIKKPRLLVVALVLFGVISAGVGVRLEFFETAPIFAISYSNNEEANIGNYDRIFSSGSTTEFYSFYESEEIFDKTLKVNKNFKETDRTEHKMTFEYNGATFVLEFIDKGIIRNKYSLSAQ